LLPPDKGRAAAPGVFCRVHKKIFTFSISIELYVISNGYSYAIKSGHCNKNIAYFFAEWAFFWDRSTGDDGAHFYNYVKK
jgi:hypothetical protein